MLYASGSVAQNHSFTIGPVVGIDQFLSKPVALASFRIASGTYVNYPGGIIYGVEGALKTGKMLVNARFMTTDRDYSVTGQFKIRSSPQLPVRVDVAARYFSFPVNVSYQIKTVRRIELYTGAGIIPELISGDYKPLSYDMYGSGLGIPLDPIKPSRPFKVGGSIEVTGRYALSQSFTLQIQPPYVISGAKSLRLPVQITRRSACLPR